MLKKAIKNKKNKLIDNYQNLKILEKIEDSVRIGKLKSSNYLTKFKQFIQRDRKTILEEWVLQHLNL